MNTPTHKIDVLDTYPVYIGNGLLSQLRTLLKIDQYSKIFVISDKTVGPQWLSKLDKSIEYDLIIIDSGESAKNVNTLSQVWHQLLDKKADRKSLVINLGGGVVGDLGGFAAATYMRGINFVQIPTTLLSQVDASVGGKLAIDFGGVKNSIGSFVQPQSVIIDVQTLATLPRRIFNEGFGEIIKHGVIADQDYFKTVTSKKPDQFSNEELVEIITRSVEIKASIIQGDEKESGDRKKLNFGHTIGHALESISLESESHLLHGEAVSIGMVAEAKISNILGLINNEDLKYLELALEKSGLPTKTKDIKIVNVLEKINSDKKSVAGIINWTLISGIGKSLIDQQVNKDVVIKALKYINH